MKDVREQVANIIKQVCLSQRLASEVEDNFEIITKEEAVDKILALFPKPEMMSEEDKEFQELLEKTYKALSNKIPKQEPKREESGKIELMSNSDKPAMDIMWDKIQELINAHNKGK